VVRRLYILGNGHIVTSANTFSNEREKQKDTVRIATMPFVRVNMEILRVVELDYALYVFLSQTTRNNNLHGY